MGNLKNHEIMATISIVSKYGNTCTSQFVQLTIHLLVVSRRAFFVTKQCIRHNSPSWTLVCSKCVTIRPGRYVQYLHYA